MMPYWKYLIILPLFKFEEKALNKIAQELINNVVQKVGDLFVAKGKLTTTAVKDLELENIGISSAYPNGELKEEVYLTATSLPSPSDWHSN
ncbi:hypothetical protein WOLCODRAFT_153128 [Wolfiporia cocos MD-104 SS10]|uniref:Uncharacterized protein n=1 Tax=Wolfiporia cocos (strain MD-104) TaxID=742152 RepID=A0A2H3JLJ4_WOLCO|nr:hypothetical protein WOLCODRAFT_153128 [Wolfiporia cocos MD-104 SS10]